MLYQSAFQLKPMLLLNPFTSIQLLLDSPKAWVGLCFNALILHPTKPLDNQADAATVPLPLSIL